MERVLAPATCMETNGFIEPVDLPTAGTYKIVVDPVTTATGNLPLKLYSFTDVSGPIGFASPLPVSLVPGQNARLTFTGTAQQHITLQSSGISGQMIGCDLNVSIVFVNGSNETVVVAPTCMEGNGLIGNTTLPSSGTYKIIVDPVSFVSGTVTLTLNDVTAPEPVSIAAGALPASLVPAASAEVTFFGARNERTPLLRSPAGSSNGFLPVNRGDTFADIAETISIAWLPTNPPVTETSLVRVNLSRPAPRGVGPIVISP